MSYPDAAWEQAMTVQEVILKALSGEIHGSGRQTSWDSRRGPRGAGASRMRRTGIMTSALLRRCIPTLGRRAAKPRCVSGLRPPYKEQKVS